MARGRRGEFRVEVDGQVVLHRKGGVVDFVLRKPWPTDEAILAAVQGVTARP